MTHLLIPLESLKKEIENNRKYLDSTERRLRNSSWDKLDTATEVLENILTHKQISLTEEDMIPSIHIVNKYLHERYENSDNPKYFNSTSSEKDFKEGYKQALKDLL